jgi:hypothetical protein
MIKNCKKCGGNGPFRDNRTVCNKCYRVKYYANPINRVMEAVYCQCKFILRQSGVKFKVRDLPFTKQEFIYYFDKLFDDWMTWDNYYGYIGADRGWQDNNQKSWTWKIVHKISLKQLQHSSVQDENFKKYWSLDNLIPRSNKPAIIQRGPCRRCKFIGVSELFDGFLCLNCRDQYEKECNDPNFKSPASQKYRNKHKDEINKKRAERRKNDHIFIMRELISRQIRVGLLYNKTNKNGKSCFNYLPYTAKELTNYIESKFEPWMNWNNHGNYDPELWDDNDITTWKWQLDHIIPHIKFVYKSMQDEDFYKCWDLSNLRPYSAKQNIIDGASRIRH